MQTNINRIGQNPQFGMAFRMPNNKSELLKLGELVKINTETGKKGFLKFKNEMDKCTNFDIKFCPEKENSLQIINNSTNEIVDEFWDYGRTGLDEFGVIKYPGKKLIAKKFHPEKLLPKSFLLAAQRTAELEKEALKNEKIINEFNKII